MSQFSFLVIAAIVCCSTVTVSGKKGFGPGEQDWGHITVRQGAHMFYWLYYTTANVKNYTERPLAIWLQGGPGASSTGYGNFEELGPLDLYLNPRNHTWVKDMNVLFIDNPVGSGFSYAENLKDFATNNKIIALDLVELMKQFYQLHPEFKTVPLHIFSEGYGGKIAPEFALELYNAIQKKEIESNLVSVALGNPWVSPIDSVNSWAPLLLNMGIVDEDGHDEIMASARSTENAVNDGSWITAMNRWSNTCLTVSRESKGVNFYNILQPTYDEDIRKLSDPEPAKRTFLYESDEARDTTLKNLMHNDVAKALNITPKAIWGYQADLAFFVLRGDFMTPVINIVEKLLNRTTVNVGVYSGQLDLHSSTPGTVNWIDKMYWSYMGKYEAAPRVGVNVDGVLEGYEKSVGNFSMIWIDRAGNMVPVENPAGMSYILRKFTSFG